MGGFLCPEFDIMKGNKYSFRTTAHTCSAPDASGAYSDCDGVGSCAVDVHENGIENDFKPGSTNGIDTDQEFHVKIEFDKDGAEQFSGYTLTLTQGADRSLVLSSTNCS